MSEQTVVVNEDNTISVIDSDGVSVPYPLDITLVPWQRRLLQALVDDAEDDTL
jgi:hypothetical protein